MTNQTEDYSQEYFEQYKKSTIINRKFIHLIDRREPVFSYLKRKKNSNSKLLDAGCGNGNFLKHASKYFASTGFDVSEEAIKMAKKEIRNADLSVSNIYDFKAYKEKFDVVTCFDVLEHIIDPRKALAALKVFMKDDGLLAISMPNGSSIGRKLKGEDWFGFHDKTHIWFYTPEHWEMLLCETGLIVEFTGGDGLGYSPYFKGLPSELDTLLIKFPTQIAGIMHFPLPKNWNETIYFVCRKNLGWESEHYKRQNKLVSKGK